MTVRTFPGAGRSLERAASTARTRLRARHCIAGPGVRPRALRWKWKGSTSWRWVPSLMRGAGDVPDDFGGAIFRVGGGFLFDGREGAEEQATDVGEDGGAAGGDAVF